MALYCSCFILSNANSLLGSQSDRAFPGVGVRLLLQLGCQPCKVNLGQCPTQPGQTSSGTFWCPCCTCCAAKQGTCIFCAVSIALFSKHYILSLQDYKKEIKLEPIKPVYSLQQIFLPCSFVCRKCCKLQHCCWLLCNHSADYELLPFGSCCLYSYDFCW